MAGSNISARLQRYALTTVVNDNWSGHMSEIERLRKLAESYLFFAQNVQSEDERERLRRRAADVKAELEKLKGPASNDK